MRTKKETDKGKKPILPRKTKQAGQNNLHLPRGADLSYTPMLLQNSPNHTPSGCTINWDLAVPPVGNIFQSVNCHFQPINSSAQVHQAKTKAKIIPPQNTVLPVNMVYRPSVLKEYTVIFINGKPRFCEKTDYDAIEALMMLRFL